MLLHSVTRIHVVLLLTVRLAGSGLPYEGRLEVFYNGVWGSVCDDYFEDVDATVACKSLGSGLIYCFLLKT